MLACLKCFGLLVGRHVVFVVVVVVTVVVVVVTIVTVVVVLIIVFVIVVADHVAVEKGRPHEQTSCEFSVRYIQTSANSADVFLLCLTQV